MDIQLLLKHRWAVLSVWLLLLLITSYGIIHIPLKTDYRDYFSKQNPYYIKDERMSSTYISGDSMLFILAPKDKSVMAPIVLQQIEEMTEEAWTLPHSVRVDSLTNYQNIFIDGDDLSVENLIDKPDAVVGERLEFIRGIIRDDTDLQGRMLSWDEKVSAVFVNFSLPGESIMETLDVAEASRELANKYRDKYPDTDIYLSGLIYGNYTSVEVLLDDSKTLLPAMGLVIILLLTYLFGSVYATTATMLIITTSIMVTMGCWGWSNTDLAGPSSSAPIIILTIAVADCVHILVSFFLAYNGGMSKRDAIDTSIRLNAIPVFITSVTTSIGFLSMNFSDVPPFQVLGNAVAFGVMMACLASLTLLPVLVDVFPIVRKKSIHGGSSLLAPYAKHLVQHKTRYFIGVVLTSFVLGSFALKNELNDQFGKFFSENREFRYATDFGNENLSSFYDLSVSLKSPYENGVYHPDYLRKVDEFEQWLKQHPEVIQTQTIATVFKSLNKAMHQNDSEWYVLPDDGELAAQYFLLYELSLPFGLDSTRQVSFDKSGSRIYITLKEQKTSQMLKFEKEVDAWLKENAPKYDYYSSSVMLMFANLSVSNAKSMLTGTVIALVLMSVVIGLALRSIRFGLISLVTNMVPPVLAFGAWGLISGQVGLSIAIAIGMTLGIVVDNTVHLLAKHQLKEKETGDTEAAMEYAFSHVGVALMICNVVLVCGFTILAQSDFSINSHMGAFTSITFVLALAVDFLILPFLLSVGRQKEQKDYAENETLPRAA